MLHRTTRFTPNSFANDVRRTLFAFVQVDRVIGRPFAPYLAGHVEERYPGMVTCGTLVRPAVKAPGWWDQHFRTAMGPIRNGVSDGTWMFESGLVVGQHAGISSITDEKQFVAYFDEIVARKLAAAGYAPPPPPRSEERAPPPPPPEPVGEEPYAVLGIGRDATDEQVRAAWKEQMKLNHPDRVSHMSPALQKFALAQTVAIQVAFDAIVTSRKGR